MVLIRYIKPQQQCRHQPRISLSMWSRLHQRQGPPSPLLIVFKHLAMILTSLVLDINLIIGIKLQDNFFRVTQQIKQYLKLWPVIHTHSRVQLFYFLTPQLGFHSPMVPLQHMQSIPKHKIQCQALSPHLLRTRNSRS